MKSLFKIKYLFCFAIFVSGLILFSTIVYFQVDDRTISNARPDLLTDGWQVTFENGSCQPSLNLPMKISAGKNEKIVLQHEITTDMAGQTLAFHTTNKRVAMRIDDEIIYTYAQSGQMPFGGSPGNLWHFITIPNITENTVVTIELESPYSNMGGELSEVLLGARSSCILFFIQSEWVGLLSGFALFLFGALYILFYFAMGHMKLKNSGLFYLGLSAILMACNMVLATGLMQIFYGNAVFYYYTRYITLYLNLVPFLMFLSDTVFEKKKRNLVRCAYALLFLFFVVLLIQLTNLLDLSCFEPVFTIIVILNLLYWIYLCIRMFQLQQAEKIHYLMIFLTIFELACVILEVVNPQYNKVSYSQYGTMTLILILGSSHILNFVTLYRIQVDRKMKKNRIYTKNLMDEQKQIRKQIEVLTRDKERAEELNNAKSQFLSNVGNELIQPMNNIIGMTELFSRENVSDSVKEKVSAIQSSGNTALTILNNLIDYSKFEKNELELKSVSYHMENMLYDMSELVSIALIEKNIEFIVDFAPHIPQELFGDEIRIRQILSNILTNAVKYTDEGVIRFRVDSALSNADEVVLKFVISDTGIGIKDEFQERLFESFIRMDHEDSSNEIEGTSLGLAICKHLLDLMNGSIKVESTYGEGTVFIIELPQKIINGLPIIEDVDSSWKVLVYETSQLQRMLLKKTCMDISLKADFVTNDEEFKEKLSNENYRTLFISQSEYERLMDDNENDNISIRKVVLADITDSILSYEHAEILQRPVQCMKLYDAISGGDIAKPIVLDDPHSFIAPEARVLIIDDNPSNLKIMTGMLEPYKMQLTTAISGAEGLSHLTLEHPFDLIFLDYSMPEMDGVAVLHQIRKNPEKYFKTLPVVAMLSHKINGAKELFLQEGFDNYIAKPLETMQLERLLVEFLLEEKIVRTEKEVILY